MALNEIQRASVREAMRQYCRTPDASGKLPPRAGRITILRTFVVANPAGLESSDIRKILACSASTVQSRIKLLARQGLIFTSDKLGTGRRQVYRLTDKGKDPRSTSLVANSWGRPNVQRRAILQTLMDTTQPLTHRQIKDLTTSATTEQMKQVTKCGTDKGLLVKKYGDLNRSPTYVLTDTGRTAAEAYIALPLPKEVSTESFTVIFTGEPDSEAHAAVLAYIASLRTLQDTHVTP